MAPFNFKYAFPNEKTGEIKISLKNIENQITLKISDNGVGLPPQIDFQNTKTLGLQLIHTLTKQLSGTITLDRNHGTTVTLTFLSKLGK